jgi:type IV secretion system protein TrbJ
MINRNCFAAYSMLVLLIISLVRPVHAGGIPVFDAANTAEAIAQKLKQIQEYQTQLQQFENQIRNTVAPAAYIWAKAEHTMNRLIQAQNLIKYYVEQGGIENYLLRYRNASFYSGSPCFQLGVKCSAAAFQEVIKGQKNSTESQEAANDSLLRGLEKHHDDMPLDAAHLELLQSNAQTAEGRMEAIQYANQLAAHQANQLLQMRNMMIAKYNAENARQQAQVDAEAMQQAARTISTKRLSPIDLPASRVWNVSDGF